MFPRQTKLEPVLTSLRNLHGFNSVTQDDWDSTGINLILDIAITQRNFNSKPWRFDVGVRAMKQSIIKAMRTLDVGFNFLHWPTLQYQWSPGVFGKGENVKLGYDSDWIKIEVLV